MLTTSTYIIKAHIPGAVQANLITLYKDELIRQGAGKISGNEEIISFSNSFFKLTVGGLSNNRYSGFSEGKIAIKDEGDRFGIYFEAAKSRMLITAAIASIISSLVFVFVIGWMGFVPGIIMFVVSAFFNYIAISSFPGYFIDARNRIERRLQNMSV